MFFNSGFDDVKKAGLLFFLLTPFMVVQVQASDAPEAADEPAVDSGSEEQQRKFSFPRWPERQQVNREVIPPAPPGPYMSSALSNFSVEGPAFARDINKPAIKMSSSDVPMEAFSPDTPWPSNIESPQQWKPENGYRFVEPVVRKKSYPVMLYDRPSKYNNGYNRRPVMSGRGLHASPYMRSSAEPSTGVNQARSYSRRPYALSPNNGSGRSPDRSNAAMNNSENQSRHPAYRAPHP